MTRRKFSEINPREYTLMGPSPNFVHFNPSGEAHMNHPLSNRLEKWILIVLLAFAMAAFVGFKLFENSELAFTLTDSSPKQSNSLSSQTEFRSEFNRNRNEARALIKEHKSSNRSKKVATKKRSSNKSKALAKTRSKKSKLALKSRSTSKQPIARR